MCARLCILLFVLVCTVCSGPLMMHIHVRDVYMYMYMTTGIMYICTCTFNRCSFSIGIVHVRALLKPLIVLCVHVVVHVLLVMLFYCACV